MALLVTPLAFGLGGEPFAPFIVNLEPLPDDPEVSSADPIRFSVRDVETFVVAGQLQVSVGYAHNKSDGLAIYEEAIPGTFLTSVLKGVVVDLEKATVVPIIDGIEITKTATGAQRSVHAVEDALVPGDQAILLTAEIRPDLISVGAQGAVFGVEHGFRNTAAYMFFTNPAGISSIRIAGPKDSLGVRVPDVEITFDWTSALRRYLILWNEIKDQVEFYVVTNGVTQRIHVEPIASFQEFDDSIEGDPTPQRGDPKNATMLWGIEGPIGDRVTFANVALATDVGFPIIGISRPGNFVTLRNSDEFVRLEAGDPRLFAVSPWFGPDDIIFSDTDPAGVAKVETTGFFTLTKNTHATTFNLYREEPGFLSSNTDGIMFEALFQVTPGDVEDGRAVGMGFMLYDAQTAWQFNLFGGAVKTMGILKAGGKVTNASDHVLPVSSIDWLTAPVRVRVTIDPRRNLVELFVVDSNDALPIMSAPFTRTDYPEAVEAGLAGRPGFIAFGHLNTSDTTGTLEVQELHYSTLYQAYQAWDGIFPDGADPVWGRVGDGFDQINPLSGLMLLGGGFGPTPLGYFVAGGGGAIGDQALDNNQLVLTNVPGKLQVFKRAGKWDTNRGAVLEARVQVTDWKIQARTGLFLILDDGARTYMWSFVDTAVGKFVGVPTREGLASFIETVGNSEAAAKLSFPIDWSQPHTYRMEYRRLDGLYIFVDNDPEPRLVILESDNVDFPTSQFLAPTVAFGQLSKEGSTSRWDFVRTMFSRGYEVSFKKLEADALLEDDIGNTQAVVLAFVEDND